MSFSVKDWKDFPDTTTPLSAAALEDLETRLSAYSDTVGALKQPLDTELTALAGLTSASNKIPYFTGSGTAGLLTLDTDGTLAANSDTTVASQKAVKTYAQPLDSELTALAGLTSAANKIPYFTGSGTAGLLDLSTINRSTTVGQTGVVAPEALGWFYSAVTATANLAYVARFVPKRDMTITKIRFVTTQAATNNDACDVGIYASDLATKLVSAGATSAVMNATAGPQAITVASTALTAGTVYYAALSYGAVGGTAAKLAMADYDALANAPALFGNATPTREILTKVTSHPLPSSLSGAATTPTQVPVLGISES